MAACAGSASTLRYRMRMPVSSLIWRKLIFSRSLGRRIKPDRAGDERHDEVEQADIIKGFEVPDLVLADRGPAASGARSSAVRFFTLDAANRGLVRLRSATGAAAGGDG